VALRAKGDFAVNHLSSFFPDPRGMRLHYQYWEPSSKGYDKVALVLHGLDCHSGSYPCLPPALLKERYKIYALDFAGFGDSPGERGTGTVLAMADAIESLCRRIEAVEGAREIHIIAHSMGAVATFLFLKRYPSRRARLAVVAPLLFGFPADATPIPAALAADIEATATAILAEPAFLEGRKAGFFVGENDPFVPYGRLKEIVDALPLKERHFASFPHEEHDPLGGDKGSEILSAILEWLDEISRGNRVS
jgi:fermentation-respiration switch protein FrsA (DUF1100 family)